MLLSLLAEDDIEQVIVAVTFTEGSQIGDVQCVEVVALRDSLVEDTERLFLAIFEIDDNPPFEIDTARMVILLLILDSKKSFLFVIRNACYTCIYVDCQELVVEILLYSGTSFPVQKKVSRFKNTTCQVSLLQKACITLKTIYISLIDLLSTNRSKHFCCKCGFCGT